jgi:hypothetical protein
MSTAWQATPSEYNTDAANGTPQQGLHMLKNCSSIPQSTSMPENNCICTLLALLRQQYRTDPAAPGPLLLLLANHQHAMQKMMCNNATTTA